MVLFFRDKPISFFLSRTGVGGRMVGWLGGWVWLAYTKVAAFILDCFSGCLFSFAFPFLSVLYHHHHHHISTLVFGAVWWEKKKVHESRVETRKERKHSVDAQKLIVLSISHPSSMHSAPLTCCHWSHQIVPSHSSPSCKLFGFHLYPPFCSEIWLSEVGFRSRL